MKNIVTNVIDAGGRFGLHPSWKLFKGELAYHLFEPDRAETSRLKAKYAARFNEVFIHDSALGENEGEIEINFLYNRAMSTSCQRHEDSITFTGQKKKEVEVVDKEKVAMTTIDKFCAKNKIRLDFLKVDTEGTEYQVLKGAKDQLINHVLGICCEVNFDYVFKDMPIFSAIHEYLLKHNFFLLNLGYNGQGFPYNEFVNAKGPYGVIRDCDAVWLKREKFLFDSNWNSKQDMEVRILKYAAFCFLNNTSDLAVQVLIDARKKHNLGFDPLNESLLYKFVDIQLQKLFYSLKWQPGQSLEKHKATYQLIFGKNIKELHEYNQSVELNPD